MNEDSASVGREVERHNEWRYLFDEASGIESVEVRRANGTCSTYFGDNARAFWLRSKGLTSENIASVLDMENEVVADLLGEDQT